MTEERYRFMIFDRPAGPWHATRAGAERDAFRQRMASRDYPDSPLYITVPGWIAYKTIAVRRGAQRDDLAA